MSQLGNKLREARMAKGYTLNTLQQITKIQKKYLVAIEEGDFDEIPGTFYTRAFIKQYADMVGLEGDELLLEYQDELTSNAPKQIEEDEAIPLPSRLDRVSEKQHNSNLDRLLKYLPVASLVLVVLLVMLILAYYISKLNNQTKPGEESTTITVVNSVTPGNTTNESAETTMQAELGENDIRVGKEVMTKTSAVGEETTYLLKGDAANFKLEVRGLNYVWVGVYINDQIITDTTVNSGDVYNVKITPEAKSLRIRLGYPEGADIYVNDTKVKIDNQYITDSILFKFEENTVSDQTDQDESQVDKDDSAETTESTGYQGPAVLDPNYTTVQERNE